MAVAALLFAVACALAVHVPVPMGAAYGEPDAAALVIDALLWVRGGVRTSVISEYRYYSSPGYIWLLTQLVPERPADTTRVATIMNALNLIASTVVVVPLFLLVRRLAGLRAATIASVLVSFLPAFWQGGQYGFPTLLAELFVLTALWGYDRWLTSEDPWRGDAWWLAAVCACLTICILLKTDIFLSAVALWGLLVYRRRVTRRSVVALAVVGLIPVAVLSVVTHVLLANAPSTSAYAGQWNRKFPVDAWGELSARHLLQLAKSMGVLTLPLFVVAIAWLARRRQWVMVATLALWAALPIAFWYFRVGDSARHHMQSTVPVAIGIALLVAALPVRDVVRAAIVAMLIIVNYRAFPPSVDTVTTSGRFVASGRQLAGLLAIYEHWARRYATLDEPQLAFVGGWRRIWYVEPEILARADSVTAYRRVTRFGLPALDVEFLRGARRYHWVSLATSQQPATLVRAAADSARQAGFRVYTMEFDSTLARTLSPASFRLVEYGAPSSVASAPTRSP